MMELHRTDVVQVSMQSEEATSILGSNVCAKSGCARVDCKNTLTPDLDLIVITTSHQERSARMDSDSSDRA